MTAGLHALRRALGIGLTWAIVWAVFWTIIGVTIGVVDPDSIDPGEGAMMVAVLGPMGLFSGIAFGLLLSIGSRGRADAVTRVVASGILGTALVQLAYLDHGDLGLAANLQMALLFCAIGGVVTLVWLVPARWWSHRRSAGPSSN